jgi:hypothetical protein
MLNFFRDGGVPMYITAIFGLFLIAASVQAIRGNHSAAREALVARLYGLTFASGALGTVTGFIMTFRYLEKVAKDEILVIAAQGVAESLNNIVLSLVLCVLASMTLAVGALRRVKTESAA